MYEGAGTNDKNSFFRALKIFLCEVVMKRQKMSRVVCGLCYLGKKTVFAVFSSVYSIKESEIEATVIMQVGYY